jgi:hypothetical protein
LKLVQQSEAQGIRCDANRMLHFQETNDSISKKNNCGVCSVFCLTSGQACAASRIAGSIRHIFLASPFARGGASASTFIIAFLTLRAPTLLSSSSRTPPPLPLL